MPFKVSARTILLLGAELISSDAIAFYELIKNAFDAGSPRVDIDVVARMKFDTYSSHLQFIKSKLGEAVDNDKHSLQSCRDTICNDIDPSAPFVRRLKERVSDADSWERLLELLDTCNYIEIGDTGCGMSLDDLNNVYLTIGTSARLLQREEQRKRLIQEGANASQVRPILGEKGLGRLSAMRLGWRMRVVTSRAGEANWNVLTVDWREFMRDTEDLIEAIPVSPRLGRPKDNPDESGTRIRISALTSSWDKKKLEDIANTEFSKLTDPFTPNLRYPISLRYNNDGVNIRPLNKILFNYAHATVKASFSVNSGEPLLSGRINYLLRSREKTFAVDQAHLISVVGVPSLATLVSLGPCSVEFYWYNRRILGELEGIGDRKAVRNLLETWAGGLMVFRDGFRVNPYGNPDDDWLDLDRRALAVGGYKVNRRQIIGKVDISALRNPALTDQTNREGLRDCEEKRVLIHLLRHIVMSEFRPFLNSVDKELSAQETVTFEELEERVENEDSNVEHNMQLLLRKYPDVKKDVQIVNTIRDSINRIREMMKEAKQLADSFEKDRTQILHLAGLGLMVEILAHELNRATQHTLMTLAEDEQRRTSRDTESLLNTLQEQLKTLQKRLRILDPLSTAGRQVKERFDLVEWVREILSSHEAQFGRHHIKCSPLRVVPASSAKSLQVHMVKGMVVQILENLLSNSVYWLDQQRKLDRNFLPEITITIDTQAKEIIIVDNGPGIPISRKGEMFQPFVTTKPPGEGKGLGLYISREIARYHGAELFLSDERTVHDDCLNTFVLSLEVSQK